MAVAALAAIFIGAVGFLEAEDNKKHIISVLLSFLFLLLLMGGNSDNADYSNYQSSYQEAANFWNVKKSYWAYYFSMFFFNKLGLSFEIYHFAIYGVGLFFIYCLMRKTMGWSLLFLLFYCIYPMMMDPTQMKNFMAMVIFSYAATFLIDSSFKNDIKYIFLVILAAGFHLSAFIYLPLFIFRRFTNKKHFMTILIVGVFAISILFSFTSLNSFLMTTMTAFIADDISSKEAYFYQGVRLGFLPYLFANIVIFLIANYLRKNAKSSFELTEYQKNFLNLVFIISAYAFLFVPFYQFTLDFARFFRDLFLIFSVGMALGIRGLSVSKQRFVISVKQGIVFGIYFVTLLILFGWDISRVYDTVVQPLFNSNVLFW